MTGVDLSDTTIEHLVAQAVESISERVTEKVLTRITEAMKPQKEDETIDLGGALRYTAKSLSDLNRGVKEGRYPRPISSQNSKRAWARSEWEKWRNKNQ